MGVVLKSSTAVGNADANPRVPNSPYFDQGEVRASASAVATGAADSAGSIYRFIRLPSSARISSLKFSNAAMAGTTSVQFGLYQTAANGGAVASAGLFANALDISAGLSDSEVLFQNLSIANGEKRLWELLGLTADPFVEYDIAMTTVTQAGAAGNMLLRGSWVQ